MLGDRRALGATHPCSCSTWNESTKVRGRPGRSSAHRSTGSKALPWNPLQSRLRLPPLAINPIGRYRTLMTVESARRSLRSSAFHGRAMQRGVCGRDVRDPPFLSSRPIHSEAAAVPLVVTCPELGWRHGCFGGAGNDCFEARNAAENLHSSRDVLGDESEFSQRHALKRCQVGDACATDL
jgi:hypothetical protein